MNLNITYDQNTLNTAPAGFFSAVNYVVSLFDVTFTNNVTVNIEIGYGKFPYDNSTVPALGESEQNGLVWGDYSQVRQALINEGAPGSSTLPSSSPLRGNLVLDSAEEKALGLIGASSTLDGWVGIASDTTLSQQIGGSWSYSASATPGANQYYLVGVLEHEITEIMGRTSYLDVRGEYGVMDLYRYKSPGIRQTGTGSPAYFSTDSGTTNLNNWNTLNGGDIGDWADNAGADAFLAFSSPGQIDGLSKTDLTNMAAIGWTTSTTVSGVGSTGAGSQYVFSVPGQTVNVISTTSGSNLPAPISGRFNVELVTSPTGTNYSTPVGFQGVAILPGGGGKNLQLLGGNFAVTDTGSGNSITGGSGAQTIIGAPSDTITGGSAITWIDGSAGQQTISGGTGSNLLIGGAGDIIIGSAGAGTAAISGARGDAIIGGYGWDVIDGAAGWQAITGGPGHTTITGGAGDVIFGSTGAGASVIKGAINDAIMGGYGSDSIDGSAGWQAITGGPGYSTITGGAGDVIYGSIGLGTASIIGAVGDAIMGGSGNDLIDGRAGGQPITGGSGNTTVWAGGGDTVFGGPGNLTVNIDHTQFTGAVRIEDTGVRGYDTVVGFSQSAGDRLSFPNETAAAIDSVVGSAHTNNGNTILTLPDGATVTLVGITHIDSSFFA
jgi:hypothetical protein